MLSIFMTTQNTFLCWLALLVRVLLVNAQHLFSNEIGRYKLFATTNYMNGANDNIWKCVRRIHKNISDEHCAVILLEYHFIMTKLHKNVFVLIDDDCNFSLSVFGCIQFYRMAAVTKHYCCDRVLNEKVSVQWQNRSTWNLYFSNIHGNANRFHFDGICFFFVFFFILIFMRLLWSRRTLAKYYFFL